MVRILHTADVQIKNRHENLSKVSYSMLKDIENMLIVTGAEIYVVAGDLFEYPEPTDSERKIVYNHLSRVLALPSVKEVVIMPGNHDLLKDKKISETNIGHNPLNSFNSLIENLDFDLSRKLTYLNSTKVFQSKVSDKIVYYAYSLEDDFNNGNFNEEFYKDTDKVKICIYHAMIKEFVDEKKIPLRKDVYNALHSLNIFPENSLVLAGDIHMDLTYTYLAEDASNQESIKFIYPGSPMQHTHNEGSFFGISESGFIDTIGEKKSVKLYKIPTEAYEDEIFQLNDIEIDTLYLNEFISYNTITINPKLSFERNLEMLEHVFTNAIDYSILKTIVKIKTSTVFLKKEKDFFDYCQKLFNEFNIDNNKLNLFFEYDKRVETSTTVENKAVKEILEEKHKAIIEELKIENPDIDYDSEEFSMEGFSAANIDDLILSNEQIEKLFKSVLDSQLKGISDVDVSNDELSKDIVNLFMRELTVLNSTSQRYIINLKSIETNGFMKLKQNIIPLDVPGLIRILGTNGIGKTTLYNMLYWVITGNLYQGMSKNKAMQNTIPIFNKTNIEQDVVFSKMNFNINGVEIVATRTAERKWKNNTTPEQKMSLNFADYISTIARDFKLDLTYASGETKQVIGEAAEALMSKWFGDTVDNILFVNQTKIENILRTNPDDLNQMILNFIGVDYLNKLESGLDGVKAELNTVLKPTKSKEDIQNSIIDAKLFIKQTKQKIEENGFLSENLTKSLNELSEKQSEANQSLTNIGNVPLQIGEKQRELSEVNKFIETFETVPLKDKVPFTEEKPVQDNSKIETHTLEKSQYIQRNETLDTCIFENNEEIEKIYVEVDRIKQTHVKFSQDEILDTKQLFNSNAKLIVAKYKELEESFDLTVNGLKDKLTINQQRLTEVTVEISNIGIKISNNIKTISSGKCEKCGKVLSDNVDEHLQHVTKLQNENLELEEKEKVLLTEKQTIISTIEKINKFIKEYSLYRDMSVANNLQIVNQEPIKEKFANNFRDLMELYAIEEGYNVKIESAENTLKLWNSLTKDNFLNNPEHAKFYPLALDEYVTKLIDLVASDIEYKKEKTLNESEIKSLETKISLIEKNYSQALEIYNSNMLANIKENEAIDVSNEKWKKHNDNLALKESDKIRISSELIVIESKLEKYNVLKLEYDTIEASIKELNTTGKEINEAKVLLNTELTRRENTLTLVEQQYTDYIQYQKNNLIWKLYSKLIKNNFKDIIFEYYRTFLNNTLNTLLEEVSFKLFWNNDSQLYMIDYERGSCSYAPVRQSSGMETCFLGLSLIYTIHLLNVKNTISHIFIDEISGTLNKGTELSYAAKNYQELLVLILSKFTEKTVFIIDHNITNLFETAIYEVVPAEGGSEYIIK